MTEPTDVGPSTADQLFRLIRSFGYTTHGQTAEIVDAIVAKWGTPPAPRPMKEISMADAFIDIRELDANTLRDISVKSGVIWPEDGDRESRLFRFRVRRIATEAYRRGVADGQKINAAVAVMFGEQPHE